MANAKTSPAKKPGTANAKPATGVAARVTELERGQGELREQLALATAHLQRLSQVCAQLLAKQVTPGLEQALQQQIMAELSGQAAPAAATDDVTAAAQAAVNPLFTQEGNNA